MRTSLFTWLLYRILGQNWGRVVAGSLAILIGLLFLFSTIASQTGGTNALIAYGFCLLILAAGVFAIVKGVQGLKQKAASNQVSYGGAGQYGYTPRHPAYPPQPAPGYGQQPYNAPYGQPPAPQYPPAAPYGQPAYPPQQPVAGQPQYPAYPAPGTPYGQPPAPQYPPAAPYGQPAYPPQPGYAPPPAGQYPPYPRQ